MMNDEPWRLNNEERKKVKSGKIEYQKKQGIKVIGHRKHPSNGLLLNVADTSGVWNQDLRLRLLFEAVRIDLEQFLVLFHEKDIDKRDEKDLSLLYMAVELNQIGIVQKLLSCGANPAEQESLYGNTSLHMALRSNETLNFEMIEMLVKANPKVLNVYNSQGMTCLHHATRLNSVPIIKLFLGYSADINARRIGLSPTPLTYAVGLLKTESVQILLEEGADYTITSSLGQMLVSSAEKRALKLISELQLDTKDYPQVDSENLEKLKATRDIGYLLEKKYADEGKILPKPFNFHTFIDKKIGKKQENMKVEELANNLLEEAHLLRKSYNVRERYKLQKETELPSNEVALRRAAATEGDNTGDIKFLIKPGTKLNEQDENPEKRRTALHWAVINANRMNAETLITAGADSTIRDAKGKTAQDYAREHTNSEIKKIKFRKSGGFNFSRLFS